MLASLRCPRLPYRSPLVAVTPRPSQASVPGRDLPAEMRPESREEFFGKNSYVREAPHIHPATKYADTVPAALHH